MHAVGLFTAEGVLVASREDVGRHNAMDKLVGAALRDGELPWSERIVLLSGRASFELIQKAMMAGAPVVAAIGAPSTLAVELAESAGITLVAFLRAGGCNVYCHPARVRSGPERVVSRAERGQSRVRGRRGAAHEAEPGPLLEILHAVQDELGCVPADAVPLIADALNLSRAEVHGVVSFYHHFRAAPAGRHLVKLCRAEACKAMNAMRSPSARARTSRRGVRRDQADGSVTLEAVYCLGNCACAPSDRCSMASSVAAWTPRALGEFVGECGVPE